MVLELTGKYKKKMQKDGSVLKYMYSVSGLGKGLVAGGLLLAFCGVLLAVMLLPSFDMTSVIRIGGVGVVPGLLFAVLGAFLQKRRNDKWLKAYVKFTHLPEEDIIRADEELKGEGVLLFSDSSSKNSNALQKMGFITPHYVRFPGVKPHMTRLEDLVACFYTKKFLCGDGGYDKAFVAYSRDKKMEYGMTDMKERAAQEIVELIAARHPAVITSHHFQYQGRQYDAVRGQDEVIALYNMVTGAGES